jgi:hypothetical protein
MGFKPTIPVFERAKTVHALDRVATVISGNYLDGFYQNFVDSGTNLLKFLTKFVPSISKLIFG